MMEPKRKYQGCVLNLFSVDIFTRTKADLDRFDIIYKIDLSDLT